jgi:hypothetical protein
MTKETLFVHSWQKKTKWQKRLKQQHKDYRGL